MHAAPAATAVATAVATVVDAADESVDALVGASPHISVPGGDVDTFWHTAVRHVAAHLRRHDVDARDAVVLLPFVQHLALARAAWVALPGAGWMPRFDTTQTLAAAAGPAAVASFDALSFDPTADALQADRLLRGHLPANWERDRGTHASIVARLVDTAQALATARLALAPAARAAWTQAARAALGIAAAGTPGALERALARLALEWAETAATDAADALHAARPATWIAVRAGAANPLTDAVLSAASVPVLWIDGDFPLTALASRADAPAIAACDDFEHEAQRAAALVIGHVARGETPVALIALDRVLLRRVRALLERQRIALADETGWRLSTTRAGATLRGLLRAAHDAASTDDVLDWLQSALGDASGLGALETAWRRAQVTAVRHVDATTLPPAAAALWERWCALVRPLVDLGAARDASLGEWLAALRDALARAGVGDALAGDAAGAQVLAALHADAPPEPDSAWADHLQATRFDAAGFLDWVQRVLEAEPFRPPWDAPDAALVVVTPLARAMLRPFAAAVCPGADAVRLGALPAAQPLLGDASARALGLPGTLQRLDGERRAFLQLLRVPRLSLLWRRADGAEPVQPSRWLLELQWAAECAGRPCTTACDERAPRAVAPQPQPRPLPSAPHLLPDRLSATVYEALRACPYRFFALHTLRLAEAEELDDALDKRDYGRWLHDVLHAFHAERDADRPEADAALLRAAGLRRQALAPREDADFLPYAASFDDLVPRYLRWLHADESRGARVEHMEHALQARPAAASPDEPPWRGRLDRIDTLRRDGVPVWRILDYKTSSIERLQAQLREPFEDTQLAFYAALLAASQGDGGGEGANVNDSGNDAGTDRGNDADSSDGAGRIEAGYLALDSRDGVKLLLHPNVGASAAALRDGVRSDLARLRAGAAMPALGEGAVCAHCSARGLCRRDHWPAAAP